MTNASPSNNQSSTKNLFLTGQKLTKQEGTFSYLLAGNLITGCPLISRYYPHFNFGTIVFLMTKQAGFLVFDLEKYQEVSELTFNALLKKQHLEQLPEVIDYQRINRKVNALYRSTTPEIIGQLSDHELKRRVAQAHTLQRELLACTVFSEAIDEELITRLSRLIPAHTLQLSDFITHSSLLTTESLTIRISSLLSRYRHLNSPLYPLQWIFCDYHSAPHIAELPDKVNQAIEEHGGLSLVSKSRKESLGQVLDNQKAVQAYKASLSSDARLLLDFVQFSITLRDLRRQYFSKLGTVISNSARELLRHIGAPSDLLPYLLAADFETNQEFSDDLITLLEKRSGGLLLYQDNLELGYEFGEIDHYEQTLWQALNSQNRPSDKIKGMVGCPGQAQGPVAIVASKKEFHKFHPGDVLVTSMTRPEFVPLMKQSAAIITDEGGITCHAAIISRELHKPCIIGTKVATKLLRDGQLVAVDADNGMVTLL